MQSAQDYDVIIKVAQIVIMNERMGNCFLFYC